MDPWFLIIGTGLVVFAIYQSFKTMVLISRGLRTTGTVIAETKSGKDLLTHVVQFRTVDGNKIEFRNLSILPEKVYSTVNIRYDPKNTKHAKIDSWDKLWGFSLIYGLIGVLLIVIGLLS